MEVRALAAAAEAGVEVEQSINFSGAADYLWQRAK